MELDKAIHTRCSVRWYKQEKISKETINELIAAGIRAPTASGLENWLFVIYGERVNERVWSLVKKGHIIYYEARNIPPEKMELLKRRMDNGMYRAPVYIGVFINRNVRKLRGDEFAEHEFIMAVESAAMAIQNLMLKAVEMGLGTCYIGVACFKEIERELKNMADLGDEYYLVGLISVGYPAEDVEPRKRKKTLNEVCKWV